MTKKILHIVLLLVFLVCFRPTLNAAYIGGSMRYELLENKKLIVYVTMFRNCSRNRETWNPTLHWSIGIRKSLYNKCGSGSYRLKNPYRIHDISTICNTCKNPCNPPNTEKTGKGVEAHEFSDTLDLNNSKFSTLLSSNQCTDLTIAIEGTGRESSVGSNSTFFLITTVNFANLNRCKNTLNKSPVFLHPPNSWAWTYTVIQNTVGAIDTFENDIVRYKAIQAYQGIFANMSVTSSYLLYAPVDCYCLKPYDYKCKANTATIPPQGFFFDTLTGNSLFFINSMTKYDLANEIEEYRLDTTGKLVRISTTMIEVGTFLDSNVISNYSPTFSGQTVYNAIVDSNLNFQINVTDAKSKNAKFFDTVFATYFTENKKIKASISTINYTNKSIAFWWKPDSSDYRKEPYKILLRAHDNNGPLPSVSTKQILVKVKKRSKVKIDVTSGYCNSIKLSITHLDSIFGTTKYTWKITDSATGIVNNASGKSTNTSTLPDGKKYIDFYLENDEFGVLPTRDSIVLNSSPKLITTGKTLLCPSDSIKLDFKTLNFPTNVPIYYTSGANYNDLLKNRTIQYKPKSDTAFQIRFFGSDALGCTLVDTVRISFHLLSKDTFSAFPQICSSHDPVIVSNYFPKRKEHTVYFYDADNYLLPDSQNNYLLPPKAIPSQKFKDGRIEVPIYITVFDSNYCTYSDTNTLLIKQSTNIQFSSSDTLCQNLLSLNLNSLLKNPTVANLGNYNYRWQIMQKPSNLAPNYPLLLQNGIDTNKYLFKFGSKQQTTFGGNYTFLFTIESKNNQCRDSLSTDIYIKNEPDIRNSEPLEYCQFAPALDLMNLVTVDSKKPKSGNVFAHKYGNVLNHLNVIELKLQNNTYIPTNIKAGLWEFLYLGPNTLCKDTAHIVLRVNHSPNSKILMRNDTALNIHAAHLDIINNSSIADQTPLKYTWDPGTGNAADISNSENFKFSYPKVISEYLLKLVVTSIYNCSDSLQKRIFVTNYTGVSEHNMSDFVAFSSNNTLEIKKGILQHIIWYDDAGKMVQSGKALSFQPAVPGIYFYEIHLLHQNKAVVFRGRKGG